MIIEKNQLHRLMGMMGDRAMHTGLQTELGTTSFVNASTDQCLLARSET